MKTFLSPIYIAVFLCAFSSNGRTALVLDQSFDTIGGGQANGGAPYLYWQQGVTAGLTGLLSQIDVFFYAPGSVDFTVNVGAPFQSDPNNYQADVTVGPGWNSIDVTAANVFLNVGDQFAIGIHGRGGFFDFDPSFAFNPDGYPGGALFLNNDPYLDGNGFPYDMNFRTFVASSVPEPNSAALIGVALAALVFRVKKRACRDLGHRMTSVARNMIDSIPRVLAL